MLTIRTMTGDDVPLGMRLKEQAGWNQVDADWRRALATAGDGAFVAELDGRVAGTVVAYVFDRVAWIAMMLVDEALRGRGIGRALMQQALDFVDRRGVQSVRLDATPLGRPLYETLGFAAEYELTRYGGDPVASGRPPHRAIRRMTPDDLPSIFELDRRTTNTDRHACLARLLDDHADDACVAADGAQLAGFVAARPGSRAHFIGPCIARGELGWALLDDALDRFAGRAVYIDVPAWHAESNLLATERGLLPQRPLLRMGRGERVDDANAAFWASSGPETG